MDGLCVDVVLLWMGWIFSSVECRVVSMRHSSFSDHGETIPIGATTTATDRLTKEPHIVAP